MIPPRLAVTGYNLLGRTYIGKSFYESFKWLSKFLEELGYPLPPEYYIGGLAFISLLSWVISFPLLVVLHYILLGRTLFFSLVLGFLASMVILLVVMGVFAYLPIIKAKSIKTAIDRNLPFTLLIMTSLAASGMSIYSVIERSLNLIRDTDTRRCFERIVKRVTQGSDVSEALYRESLTTSSYMLAETLEGLASLSQTGVGVVSFLEKVLSDCIDQLESRLREVVEKLSVLMETYVIVALVFPLLMMITVLFLGGMGGLPLPPKALMMLISFIVVPVIFIFLILVADSMLSTIRV